MSGVKLFAVVLTLLCSGWPAWSASPKPNVLFILLDDLKPVLGAYGDLVTKTPAMDKLAASGMRFDLAFVNQAVCAPSRYNLLLGARSTSSGLYDLGDNLRAVWPDAVTLPQYFSRHGYQTHSLGKVFHIGHGNNGDDSSFDVPPFKDKIIEYLVPESTGGGGITREEAYFTNFKTNVPNSQLPRGAAWEAPDVSDEAYADGRVATETIRRLEAWKASPDKPFFMAVGMARPHLPFSAPKKYWDLYDPAKLPMPVNKERPKDAPRFAGKEGGEIIQYTPIPAKGEIDAELTRKLIHGYYASTSYADAQIGRVLEALERLGLASNTIVILWGDHGYHLGDHGYWTKHTNYEEAMRIPLLIRAPGITKPGSSTKQPAETVDLYPTLAELAGLPVPNGPQPIDGTSLVPVLKDPSKRVSDHVYHVFPRERGLGRAIRTERYRMVEWKKIGEPAETADIELYDYQTDPHETQNLAASQPEVVASLRKILDQHPEARRRGNR